MTIALAGASGNLGADAGSKSASDGYTLVLMDVGNLVISPALYKLPFNVLTDFAPVAMVGYTPTCCWSAPKFLQTVPVNWWLMPKLKTAKSIYQPAES